MLDKRMPIAKILLIIPAMLLVFGLLFFPPAGTINYWQAWVYIIIIMTVTTAMTLYLYKNDPALLERRLKFREKKKRQKWIITSSYPVFILVFILPGFDQRFGWSNLPSAISIAADLLLLLSYGLIFLVYRENSYTSRVVEVSEGQKIISTGPYAVVRHPLYSGMIMMYLLSPLALGSWVAAIPAPILVAVLILRLLDEEKTLSAELDGYHEYMQKVRCRLIPGIW